MSPLRAHRLASRRILGLCVLVFASWAERAMALTCTSLSTGNWNVVARWSCGRVPIAADTAVIANTHTITVNANATVGAVTVNAGGTLNVRGVNFTVNGATGVSGTLAHVTSTAGTKTYIGPVTINAGGVWNNAINAAVTFRGGITHNGTTFTGGIGTQTFDTNNQTIGGASPINFGGAVAVGNSRTVTNNNTSVVTIAGNLTGGNATSTWANGANATLNYGGAAAPMGTRVFTANAAGNTVNYTRAGVQTVRSPTGATYYHLTLSGSGVKTLPGAMTMSGNFTMAGTASTTAAGALTVSGNFTVGAGTTFAANTFSHSVRGNFSNSGTFTANTSRFTFNGTVVQSITAPVATTFYNVTMNNAAGLTLNNNVTVSNVLTLTSGVIATGSNTLIASTSVACSASVSRTSGHIAGNLQKRIPTGAPGCTFEIGDATTYRPINTTFASVSVAGNVTAWSSQTPGDHPDTVAIASGVDPAKSVNRYWTLTNSGVTFTTCTATFNYVAGDLDGGATPASFVVARGSSCSGSGGSRTCGTWASLTPSSASSTQTTVGGLTAFGDFAIGQAKPPNFSREREFIYTRERY